MTKISLITVTYNSEEYLESTFQSVINQTYNNLEYIVIDGGSSDGTVDLIKRYENYIDYWVSEKDEGIYDAMNKGISLATGEIIGIINSDDWLEASAVERVVDIASAITVDEFIVHGKISVFDAADNFIEERYPKKIPGYYLFSTPFKHPAMFVSKKLYKQVGLYNISCGLAADYDMMLRIISSGSKSVFIDKVLTNVRLVGVSTGGNKRATNKELMIILKSNTGSWFKTFLGLFVRTLNRWIR